MGSLKASSFTYRMGRVKGRSYRRYRSEGIGRAVMRSRGIWRIMGSRARKGLTLSWMVLFLFSLLLQYFTFAVSPVLAVHSTDLFELDGNVANDAAIAGDDWASHP